MNGTSFPALFTSEDPISQNVSGLETVCSADYDVVKAFSSSYAYYHGYASIVVCFVGFTANIFNTIVLTRKNLRTPTNAVLVSISAADIATISVFVPYLVIFYFTDNPRLNWNNAVYELVYAHASLIAHTASVWLTVALGLFRCLSVRLVQGEKCCTYSRVGAAVACVVVASILTAAPQFALLYVDQDENGKWFVNDERRDSAERDQFLKKVQLWLVIVLIKLGPCLLLGILSGNLICTVVDARRTMGRWSDGNASARRRESTQDRAAKRTTAMLITVVVIFAVIGFPQALLLLLSVFVGHEFFMCSYLHLASLFDLLTIFNSSTNFVIYCAMSKQFRDTFRELLCASFWTKCTSRVSGPKLRSPKGHTNSMPLLGIAGSC